jgi:hypothetical protein
VTSAMKKLRRSDLSAPGMASKWPSNRGPDETRASSGADRHLVADTAVMRRFAFMTITRIP